MGDYQVSTTNVEIELGSPTLVNLTKFVWMERSCGNLAKIIVGMVSPCIFVVVCVSFHLIHSLLIMHGRVSHLNELYVAFNHLYVSCACF